MTTQLNHYRTCHECGARACAHILVRTPAPSLAGTSSQVWYEYIYILHSHAYSTVYTKVRQRQMHCYGMRKCTQTYPRTRRCAGTHDAQQNEPHLICSNPPISFLSFSLLLPFVLVTQLNRHQKSFSIEMRTRTRILLPRLLSCVPPFSHTLSPLPLTSIVGCWALFSSSRNHCDMTHLP